MHDRGWDELENGELLKIAQEQFDVLITTDSNIKSYLPLVPEIEDILTVIQPSEVIYVYAGQKLALKDQRKGKKRRKSDGNG